VNATSSSGAGRAQAAAGNASSATLNVKHAWQKDFPTTWLYVTYPRRGPCFALICGDGVITATPPIARWCRGEATAKVVYYYRRRGAKVEEQVS
jgi:hypothetical protein